MIIHADMDAFYAAVEIRERPELAQQPVIVGGISGRGVVSTANYVARTFGVHSAMPVMEAKRRCSRLVCLPVRMNLYAEVSQQIREIFARYTPDIEPLSLDEAFLNVTASERLFGGVKTIGQAIKQTVLDETGLVCSVGIAKNKYIAKVASDINKPDGFVYVAPQDSVSFLEPLPVSRLWGAGKVTQEKLQRYGLITIGDVRQQSLEFMQSILGKVGVHFWQLAHAEDDRRVISTQKAKSISHETTFDIDVQNKNVLLSWLLQLTEQVGFRLRQHNMLARTVKLKIRYADFKTVSHSSSLPQATDVTDTLWQLTRKLFQQSYAKRSDPVRLIGMGVSGMQTTSGKILNDETEQADLFLNINGNMNKQQNRTQLDSVTDAINIKYGKHTVKRGRGIRLN